MYASTNSTVARTLFPRIPVPAAAPQAVRIPGADPDPLQRLASAAKVEKNRTIYFEGDDAEHCYRVRSGTVRLCKVTEDGRRQIAAFLTAGDIFGWADKDAYNFSAEAVTDVTLEKYPRGRIEEIVRNDPALGRRILAELSSQLASAQDHLLLLGRMTAAERIASFLLDLVKRQRHAIADAASIELPMNRKDVADYLGLTVETVSRTMNAMKRKGIIFFSAPENVQLTQSSTLERLAMAA